MDYTLTGTYTFLVVFLVFLLSLQYTTAIRCLSCNDVIQPRHCSGIEHCPEGDACVTESYRNKNGETLFNVGCLSAQVHPKASHQEIANHFSALWDAPIKRITRCSLNANLNISASILRTDIIGTHQRNVCTECCHSDMCNAAGCGMNGFPQQRGPVCFNCPQSRDPADCDVISVCLQGEVCHVEEIFEFGDVFYKTSCVRNTDHQCNSSPIYNPVEIGRRGTRRDNCFLCCPDDLCNTKCHPSTSPVPTPVPSTTHMPISQHNVATSHVPSTTTPAPINHGFKGKEFFLMYIENYVYSHSSIKLRAIITSPATNANIEVITQYNSTSYHFSGPTKHINIEANMTMRENGRTSKGVILISDTPVSVTAFNFYIPLSTSSGGYLALPVDSLGVDYIVGTARPNKDHYEKYGTSFAVGAPYDNTVVNITLSTSGVSVPGQYHMEGDKITIVLDKLDTFYIETNTTNHDLTGTRIVSDKPVAVVSGNLCSIADGGCNHLVEYLPPVSKWGTRFMVPPITNSTRGIIRIISSISNTTVVVISETSNKTYSVSTHVDIDTNSTQPYAISSDQPVLVLLLIYERKVAMTLVPSINQFSNKLIVSPPTSTVYDNYLVVSIRTIDQSGLQLRAVNGTDLSTVGTVRFPDADGEMYSFITVSCNNNKTCSVKHTNNNVAFSVIVYGFEIFETYAYPANLML